MYIVQYWTAPVSVEITNIIRIRVCEQFESHASWYYFIPELFEYRLEKKYIIIDNSAMNE